MKNFTRRSFIQTSFTGALGLSLFPMIKGYRVGANDTIRVGIIGLGRQAVFLINGFHEIPEVKIVAGSDVYGIKRERFELMVKEHQRVEQQSVEADTYEDYQNIIERDDIDVVVIATPDHWHALQTVDACRAGKDVYLEKPITYTVEEGRMVVSAVSANNVILGVGSQQRSDPNFQHAVTLVRDGRLGAIKRINAWVGPPPDPYNLPEERPPEDLNWEKWLGPLQYVHYHPDLNPPISLNPRQDETFWARWRYFKETGGGFMMDWGAHNFDIAQWVLDRDDSGPVRVIPAGHEGRDHVSFIYDDDIEVINAPFTSDEGFGVKIWGEDSWFEVKRGFVDASDDSLLPEQQEADEDVPYETGTPHLINFIEAVKSRRNPVATAEIGHRANTIGVLGNIASFLDRPLQWDPVNERFVNDSEADGYLHREYRNGYQLK